MNKKQLLELFNMSFRQLVARKVRLRDQEGDFEKAKAAQCTLVYLNLCEEQIKDLLSGFSDDDIILHEKFASLEGIFFKRLDELSVQRIITGLTAKYSKDVFGEITHRLRETARSASGASPPSPPSESKSRGEQVHQQRFEPRYQPRPGRLAGPVADVSLLPLVEQKFVAEQQFQQRYNQEGGSDYPPMRGPSAGQQPYGQGVGLGYQRHQSAAQRQPSSGPDLVEIYKQTKDFSESNGNLNAGLTERMVSGTVAHVTKGGTLFLKKNGENGGIDLVNCQIPSDYSRAGIRGSTSYEIQNLDSFVAARELLDNSYNPLVVNAANSVSIGGGVEQGTRAQEESLFRSSNYYLALYPHGRRQNGGEHAGRYYYNNPIDEFGSYYTPFVQVFRDSMRDYAFHKPFSVACIAVAGYNLGENGWKQHGNGHLKDLKVLGLRPLLEAFESGTKEKIRHILEVAIFYKHDSLVLPALSCGAFRLPGDDTGITAGWVAKAYEEVLREDRYQGRFKNITFAVLGGHGIANENHKIFGKMVSRLQELSLKRGPVEIKLREEAYQQRAPQERSDRQMAGPQNHVASASEGGGGLVRFSSTPSPKSEQVVDQKVEEEHAVLLAHFDRMNFCSRFLDLLHLKGLSALGIDQARVRQAVAHYLRRYQDMRDIDGVEGLFKGWIEQESPLSKVGLPSSPEANKQFVNLFMETLRETLRKVAEGPQAPGGPPPR